VQALGITQMRIGPQIDPGVPWCHAASPAAAAAGLHLALKSGNFGGTDFFTRAFATLRH
jgi:3-dehydrotetronate 4-kinase